MLHIAPSAYRRHAARRQDQAGLSRRAQRDLVLVPVVEQVWNANIDLLPSSRTSLK